MTNQQKYIIGIALMILGIVAIGTIPKAEAAPYDTNFPDIIQCEYDDGNGTNTIMHVIYRYSLKDTDTNYWGLGNSVRQYESLTYDGVSAIIYNEDGTFNQFAGSSGTKLAGLNCDGTSINTLITNSQAFNYSSNTNTSTSTSSVIIYTDNINLFLGILLFYITAAFTIWIFKK